MVLVVRIVGGGGELDKLMDRLLLLRCQMIILNLLILGFLLVSFFKSNLKMANHLSLSPEISLFGVVWLSDWIHSFFNHLYIFYSGIQVQSRKT